MGIGSWDAEFCLWAARDQTLLSNTVRMHIQFITGSVEGILFLPLGVQAANTSLH